MSVNFGAGLAPAPNNPNANDAPPPQQPVAQPNAPTIGAAAPATSPLAQPIVGDTIANSTPPTLNARQSLSLSMKKLGDDWIRVEKAILEGDLKLVHRMLDEGLVPCVVEEDAAGDIVYNSLPKDIFRHLQDIDLFDRFIDLFTQHGEQSNLYQHTIQVGNCILLRRLVQSGVEGWREVHSKLDRLMAHTIREGDAKQLNAVFQLKKETFTMVELDWNDIWLHVLDSKKKFLSLDVVETLVRNLKPTQFLKENLVDIFFRAAEKGDDGAVSCLVEWLGDDLSELAEHHTWKYAQGSVTIELFAALVKGGLPPACLHLPSVSDERAQEFQLVLYGPKLSKSPFAQVLRAPDCSPVGVIDFVFTCTFGEVKGPALNRLSYDTKFFLPHKIANALFQNGLALPLAVKLGEPMCQYISLATKHYVDGGHRLGYLAYLNESVQPDAIDLLQDPLAIEQAKIIHDALLTAIEQHFGDSVGFFARALACINLDSSINTSALDLIYRQRMGLPQKIVAQIEATLKAACAEVMVSAVPLNLIKPGMTGVELQAAFHGWIQKSVARLLIARLPLALGVNIGHFGANDSSKGSVDAADELAISELEAPVRYLATSVISQYARLLAEDVEANTTAMVEVCRALPADTFKLTKADYVSSSDEEWPPISEEEEPSSADT